MLGLLLWFLWMRPEHLLWNLLRPCCKFFWLNMYQWWSILMTMTMMMMTTTELWTIDELCQSTYTQRWSFLFPPLFNKFF